MSNMEQNIAPLKQQPKFSAAIRTDTYQKLINNTLGDPERAKRFISSITSAVAVNPALQDCRPSTILAGALLGESLNLSPSPQLGQYYLVPFKQKAKYDKSSGEMISPECSNAQFVLGYKGYVQLALRSGYYTKLNVLEIKEGEFKHFDPLNEVLECLIIEDYEKREAADTVGYYAMFEYSNGFKKAIYWSKEKMMSHANQYSPAFSSQAYKKILAGEIPNQDLWKYSSFWYKNFDAMAKKTMLRQLISQWGIMSTELQTAYVTDSCVRDIGGNSELITMPEEQIDLAQPEATDIVEEIDLSDV